MFTSSSNSLIPYTKPITPLEFIKSEVQKGISNGSIKLGIPYQISSSNSLLSNDTPLTNNINSIILNLNLPFIGSEKSFNQPQHFLSKNRVTSNLSLRIMPEFFFNQLERSSKPMLLGKHSDSLEFDNDFSLWQLSYPSLSKTLVSSSKTLNGDEIAEVLQSEASFTIATDKKPIVATYGCSPCVAVGGYDPTNKIAFIVHFSHAEEVTKCGGEIFWNISRLAKEKFERPIQIHLRGGLGETSEKTIKAIKRWMTWRKDIPMEIASEDILDNHTYLGGKSLLIDSRTGDVSEYDPMDNPKHREMSRLDEMFAIMSAFSPNIRIAYKPK